MPARAAVILAAGQGTRMKSDLPKVLHPVGGRAMIDWSIALARAAGCTRIVVVCGPDQSKLHAHVEAVLGQEAIAIQERALGTGHAVRAAEAQLSGFEGDLVVLYGDTPLIPVDAIEALFAQLQGGASVGVLGFEARDPGAYGRLITNTAGELEAIVEAREASPDELAETFCNSGVMAGDKSGLFALLARIDNDNAKGEYYLTDCVGLARGAGGVCRAVRCAEVDVLGVNSRHELARAEAAFQTGARDAAMTAGVTLRAPETVFFSYDTQLGRDVVVEPNVIFAPGVSVEPGAWIRAFSHLEGARVAQGAEIGPYARLRSGAEIGTAARIGNFVEVKAVRVGAGARANHLAYLGDGEVGAQANIGAGTIFCNYDGFSKHETHVGDGAFIGSNSALVAPVTIGDGAYVASGSVVTRPVASDSLALARARQTEKPGWAATFRARRGAGSGKTDQADA